MVRRLMALVLIGVVALPAVAASAQQYPPASGTLTVDHTVVAPGGSVAASGNGCVGNSTTTFTFDSTSVGTTTANSSGAFSATVKVPGTASNGDHTLSSSCPAPGGGTRVLGATVTVNRALPRTGSSHPLSLAVVAAGLVVVGAALVTTVRNRRAASV